MDRDKTFRILRYSFFAITGILTLLFFLDIKFMVFGLNILEWDAIMAAVWIFVRSCRWACRENTGKRTLAVIAITLLGLFVTIVVYWYRRSATLCRTDRTTDTPYLCSRIYQ